MWNLRGMLGVLSVGAIPWVVVLARCLVGGVFVLAGFSKLMLPPAEVAAVMRQYVVIPDFAVPLLATGLPWLEVLSGTALMSGFYTTLAALVVGGQLLAFSLLMLVVLISGIHIEDCGCFGNLGLRETPLQVLGRDLVMLACLVPVLRRTQDMLSVDAWGQSDASAHVPQ